MGATDSASYEEIIYEGYGPAGVAVTVEVMTDNRNRAAADVRHAFIKCGGNLGESGCVAWMFKSKGVFVVEQSATDEDTITLLALDAGAEDVKVEEEAFVVLTEPDAFDAVEKALQESEIPTVVSKITNVADTTIALAGKEAEQFQKMLDMLEDLDDVQNVYHNADLPEEVEE